MTWRLKLDIRSYWHPGTGRGAGTALDALSHRDSLGLPCVPGRSVRGLCRDVLVRAADLGWFGDAEPRHADVLFGWRPMDSGEQRPKDIRPQGALRVSDAVLPVELADYLANSNKGQELVAGLYRSFAGTAVDPKTGTAKERSLRGMELIVPLELYADLEPIPGRDLPADWPALLRKALPLLLGLGSGRNRGLGRVQARLEEVQ